MLKVGGVGATSYWPTPKLPNWVLDVADSNSFRGLLNNKTKNSTNCPSNCRPMLGLDAPKADIDALFKEWDEECAASR